MACRNRSARLPGKPWRVPMKLVIISNRLPVTLVQNEEGTKLVRSGGGLATGLDSLETSLEKRWIGWPGLQVEDAAQREQIDAELAKMLLHPVYLSPEQIQLYYEGFSNSALWPLCHYFFSHIQYDKSAWEMYKEVNSLFCTEALKVIEPGDYVWVHDYHLMLLPDMLRRHIPDIGIGYFHHIPFPSYEMFRCLPERDEILRGLLGADLVGFHTHDYMRHFLSTVYRVLNVNWSLDEAQLRDRICRVDAFPMGIHYDLYSAAPEKPEAKAFAEELRLLAGDCKVVLSIDRLDYSKGILTRLKAYADFLENSPEQHGKVTLLMVLVPSRDMVDKYAELKTEIDTMIGYINGRYASVGWAPIHYFYRSFDLEELAAMYYLADAALVTPLRDGMNLVAKEFVAAKRDRPGVLILGEMAGAAVELTDALIVNPTDAGQIEDALRQALSMPEEEQMEALHSMQEVVRRGNVNAWADDFFAELRASRERNLFLKAKQMGEDNLRKVTDAYAQASHRLLMLDYDGTLSPITRNPAKAAPTPQLLELLSALAADPKNKVIICSGRDQETLERWLGSLPVDMTAEHGAFYREKGVWHQTLEFTPWDEDILKIMRRIANKTPRSHIEFKRTTLVWHYREVDSWLAELRVNQLSTALLTPCSRKGLQIMRGRKIVEVKPADFNKGTDVQRLLDADTYDFILALGDDVTDEDMFEVLPKNGISIKIGPFSEKSKYFIPEQADVQPFLMRLASIRP